MYVSVCLCVRVDAKQKLQRIIEEEGRKGGGIISIFLLLILCLFLCNFSFASTRTHRHIHYPSPSLTLIFNILRHVSPLQSPGSRTRDVHELHDAHSL